MLLPSSHSLLDVAECQDAFRIKTFAWSEVSRKLCFRTRCGADKRTACQTCTGLRRPEGGREARVQALPPPPIAAMVVNAPKASDGSSWPCFGR